MDDRHYYGPDHDMQAAYNDGFEAGEKSERAAIVSLLRERGDELRHAGGKALDDVRIAQGTALLDVADEIERGDHWGVSKDSAEDALKKARLVGARRAKGHRYYTIEVKGATEAWVDGFGTAGWKGVTDVLPVRVAEGNL